ncbi:hypothetical protein HPB49_006200 [Dermacentor silvarum]|uniref:Uncharacterized protein n=1 Tax=Dermacentor silvarum TaxID=543639 RepID=A0ACB8CDK3_DERSI|nr:hypothetical protein HPB49_006200 [Dermacentor silvarum]
MEYAVVGEDIPPGQLTDQNWVLVTKHHDHCRLSGSARPANHNAATASQRGKSRVSAAKSPPKQTHPAPQLRRKQPPLLHLPVDEYKVVMRPRGGLSLRTISSPALLTATTKHGPLHSAAGRIRTGIICNAYWNEVQSEILDGFLQYNPKVPVVAARCLGQTASIVITFAGTKVPRSICFRAAPFTCHTFYNHVETYFNCRQTGHCTDASPRPVPHLSRRCDENTHPLRNPRAHQIASSATALTYRGNKL